jgi:DMSO/TMAO reductase YedYZ molybdopterin-dependent catalytic subunit
LQDWITPNEKFYVRCHFPVPTIEAKTWRLRVEGEVESPLALTYDQLREMPSRTITATVECAGNGRSFLQPKVKGVAWDIGAVGNAEWTGVLLRDVLQRARVKRPAIEAILEGVDKGELKEDRRPNGEINFARSLPLHKATYDVLLAYAMNGEALTAAHGFPLRAIVPGWFGMASVKWLHRVVLTPNAFTGYYQTIDYAYWTGDAELPELKPITAMQLKAQIARPAPNEQLPANTPYRVHGAAWVGAGEIGRVEISADEGITWSLAKLLGNSVKNAWRFWEYQWKTPAQSGSYTLMARAVDSHGRMQQRTRVPNHGPYIVDHWLPIEFTVR